MSKKQQHTENAQKIREIRKSYDQLKPGDVATIRRCKSADDLLKEPVFWRVVRPYGERALDLAHVVLLFPLAKQSRRSDFKFGLFLKNAMEKRSDKGALRFRRLLDSRDRDDLDHRMRGLLRLTCADDGRIHWGNLGSGMIRFFESPSLRREWAQDFYAPSKTSDQSNTQAKDQP